MQIQERTLNLSLSKIKQAVEIEEIEPDTAGANEVPERKIKEHRVPIDHESFYDGRVYGETKSRATVHMEVSSYPFVANFICKLKF